MGDINDCEISYSSFTLPPSSPRNNFLDTSFSSFTLPPSSPRHDPKSPIWSPSLDCGFPTQTSSLAASSPSVSSPLKSPPSKSPIGSPSSRRRVSDRFIPCRCDFDVDLANYNLCCKENTQFNRQEKQPVSDKDDAVEAYRCSLASTLFEGKQKGGVLSLGLPSPSSSSSPLDNHNASLNVIYSQNKRRNFRNKSLRVIPQTPERILDAPELLDDFYLNLLDWGVHNVLVVALNQTVYLWNAESGVVQQLLTTQGDDNIITSVSWSPDGSVLAVGINSAQVQLWDPLVGTQISTVGGHMARIGSLAWSGNTLASGSRDYKIRLHDVRTRTGTFATLAGHQQEVCGLKWSLDGSQLASGGNDNLVNIWDVARPDNPRLRLREHTAAVKALGWSPHHSNLLASGGGTADRTVRFWNTSSGACLQSIDTKSQVCSLLWSTHSKELVTSHGFSDNQLSLWKYPSLRKIVDLTGHSSRVLHLALSPDGQTVVSAAGDETIRFWKCFASDDVPRVASPSTPSGRLSTGSTAMNRSVKSGRTARELFSGGYMTIR